MKTVRKIPPRPIPMTTETDPAAAAPPPRKPRIAYLIATSFGLGYLPFAPGTLGSLAGVALAAIFAIRNDWIMPGGWLINTEMMGKILFVLLSGVGVWAADRVAKDSRKHDPQFVIIDEVSGQWLAFLLGSVYLTFFHAVGGETRWAAMHVSAAGPPNWKYLLLGLILFRSFDIWKPFPVRQAESLPGGWGIMADDWLAAIYAAIGLWIARALGL
jgi:phosphatidylglycerophosphatase A